MIYLVEKLFFRGLKHELKFDVKLLKPSIIHDVIAIALQIDAKLIELRPLALKALHNHKSMHASIPIELVLKPKPHALPFKKLTPTRSTKKE